MVDRVGDGGVGQALRFREPDRIVRVRLPRPRRSRYDVGMPSGKAKALSGSHARLTAINRSRFVP